MTATHFVPVAIRIRQEILTQKNGRSRWNIRLVYQVVNRVLRLAATTTGNKTDRAEDGEGGRFGYGYRRVTALLHREGWKVNHKRVERLWRQEGLKIPKRQPKRRRLWLSDGSWIRLRPQRRDHVWGCDFVHDQISDGRPLRMLTLIDEHRGD